MGKNLSDIIKAMQKFTEDNMDKESLQNSRDYFKEVAFTILLVFRSKFIFLKLNDNNASVTVVNIMVVCLLSVKDK